MNSFIPLLSRSLVTLVVLLLGLASTRVPAADVKLLNVSYDPTRELYNEVNTAFAKLWKTRNAGNVTVLQIPRRLRKTGPLRHRRIAGRHRDPGAGV